MNAICILIYCIAAIVFFCCGMFWEAVAFLALAELASVHERIRKAAGQ